MLIARLIADPDGLSARIDAARAALDAQDLESRQLVDWFLSEQVEEEATVSEILDQIKLVGNDGSGLLRIDERLAGRTDGGAA